MSKKGRNQDLEYIISFKNEEKEEYENDEFHNSGASVDVYKN